MKKYLLLFVGLAAGVHLAAQKDITGSTDHPLLSRYPGSYITYYETVKHLEYDLATGPVTGYRTISKREKVPGQVTRITYFLDRSTAELSLTEVYQDYVLALEKAGLGIISKGMFPDRNVKGDVGGGGWVGVALGPQPFRTEAAANLLFKGTSSSGGTFAVISRLNRPDGLTYLALYGERHSSELVVVHLDVIESKAAETGLVSANADYIRQEIEDRGSVAIYGIQFDFNSSTLKPESAPVLAEIARYLADNPTVGLYVVGHTDMKGSLEYNLQLSQARAGAVVQALVQDHGIATARLTAQGVAFLSPKATNSTEEGRAINRRTELVRRGAE